LVSFVCNQLFAATAKEVATRLAVVTLRFCSSPDGTNLDETV